MEWVITQLELIREINKYNHLKFVNGASQL